MDWLKVYSTVGASSFVNLAAVSQMSVGPVDQSTDWTVYAVTGGAQVRLDVTVATMAEANDHLDSLVVSA